MYLVIFFWNVPQGHGIIFTTKGVEVKNKSLLARLYQYLGKCDKNSAPQGKSRSFKTFKCLKTRFEANKTTEGNVFVINLFKIFLSLKTCEGFETSLTLLGATALFHSICIITVF